MTCFLLQTIILCFFSPPLRCDVLTECFFELCFLHVHTLWKSFFVHVFKSCLFAFGCERLFVLCVLGSDVVGDEHKQPKCSADTSVSAPAEPPASPVTQNVPKTPPNEAVEPEGNGFTGPASPEPSERKAEQPEVKDSQNIIEVKTPPPPTPEPNPAGAGTQTGAGQQEKDKRVPPAEEEESQKENSHLIDHEQDEGHNSEPEESFQTPPCSPKRSPKEAKVGSDSSSGEDQSKEDEGEAALSEPKHSQ